MIEVNKVEFKPGTTEELLPDFDDAFPCITTCCPLREETSTPWHWHQAVELFYIEKGTLEYVTPSDRYVFHAGSGGIINSNVLHMTHARGDGEPGRQLLHLFDPLLISGTQGSRIEEKYILPLTTAAGAEIVPLSPDVLEQKKLLDTLRASFSLSPGDMGYELRLRAILSELWLGLLDAAAPRLRQSRRRTATSEQIKQMMVYIHDHCGESLTTADIAKAACVSQRTCFSLFQTYLHTTPMKYVQSHRLRLACQLLAHSRESVTQIGNTCGLGSGSHFASLFRAELGLTPTQYRSHCRRREENL